MTFYWLIKLSLDWINFLHNLPFRIQVERWSWGVRCSTLSSTTKKGISSSFFLPGMLVISRKHLALLGVAFLSSEKLENFHSTSSQASQVFRTWYLYFLPPRQSYTCFILCHSTAPRARVLQKVFARSTRKASHRSLRVYTNMYDHSVCGSSEIFLISREMPSVTTPLFGGSPNHRRLDLCYSSLTIERRFWNCLEFFWKAWNPAGRHRITSLYTRCGRSRRRHRLRRAFRIDLSFAFSLASEFSTFLVLELAADPSKRITQVSVRQQLNSLCRSAMDSNCLHDIRKRVHSTGGSFNADFYSLPLFGRPRRLHHETVTH